MSAATKNQTTIEVSPTVPTVTITREFAAPVALVFRAYTEPDLFRQWIGPRDRTFVLQEFDCRTGGAWRYSTTDENFEAKFFGTFHEVRPGERIVQTFTFEGFPDQVALETAVFEDLGDGRSRVTSVSLVDSFEARDGFVASGMESGVVEGYEKMDELLATLG
ncbi:MAG: SRPBCC family protein [Nocardioidaceae bacterium]